jgi:hypothetical protein
VSDPQPHSVRLTFQPAVNDITEMAAYVIHRAVDGGAEEELVFCAVLRDLYGSIIGIDNCTTETVPTSADKQFWREMPVTYVDTDVSVNHTYCYRVQAFPLGNNLSNGQGPPSAISSQVCITIGTRATAPVLQGQVINNDAVVLDWTASTIEDSTIASYQIFRSVDGADFTLFHTTDGVTLEYEDDAVAINHVYSYYVVGVPVLGGSSLPSNVVTESLSIFFTSQIYPVLVVESLVSSGLTVRGRLNMVAPDLLKVGGDFLAGTLALGLFSYTDGLPEALKVGGDFLAGSIQLGLISYTNGAAEALKVGGDFLAGSIQLGLITYSNWPAEGLVVGGDFLAGTLT